MALRKSSEKKTMTDAKRPPLFKPTLIIHGGAGNITRDKLPPPLYQRYRASLLNYLRSTYQLLQNGSNALDAAVHAVSLLEDDELFNCGRGSVFTSAGTIEMEASLMVTSLINDDNDPATTIPGKVKRGVGVIGLRNVRHPIQLAREVLLRTGIDEHGHPRQEHGGNMHSQLSGRHLEKLARDWGLEFKPDEWFWTQRRWQEHRRGLERGRAAYDTDDELEGLSQGTVGCVCLDQWGNLAVATSTGGMTNKLPGRVGDTPTLGAGFWAETWEEESNTSSGKDGRRMVYQSSSTSGRVDGDEHSSWSTLLRDLLHDCLSPIMPSQPGPSSSSVLPPEKQPLLSGDSKKPNVIPPSPSAHRHRRRAVALSGTGNGDSFLRINAARTASAMLRFSSPAQNLKLSDAVTAVAGPGGELQQSAGPRWGITGEGEGGLIGIEAEIDLDENQKPVQTKDDSLRRGRVVFDFNCGGMYRAWIEEGPEGRERERVMVFKDEYVE